VAVKPRGGQDMIIQRFQNDSEKRQLILHTAQEWDKSKAFYTTPHMRDKYFYPLTDPKCVPVPKATHMHDNDHVVGIYHKGKARAYALYIMDYYHHLNDVIEDDPLVFST
jgi:hypothetical protein